MSEFNWRKSCCTVVRLIQPRHRNSEATQVPLKRAQHRRPEVGSLDDNTVRFSKTNTLSFTNLLRRCARSRPGIRPREKPERSPHERFRETSECRKRSALRLLCYPFWNRGAARRSTRKTVS